MPQLHVPQSKGTQETELRIVEDQQHSRQKPEKKMTGILASSSLATSKWALQTSMAINTRLVGRDTADTWCSEEGKSVVRQVSRWTR